jgi:LuxR family transcriptional regulator/LuxR family quorum-sensing system transcriptional regulator CciR
MLTERAADFARARSEAAVWRLLLEFAAARGFARTLYLHLPPPLAEERPCLMVSGDAGAAAAYLAERLFEVDPALRMALRATGPFRLAEAFRPGAEAAALPERARAALAALRGGAAPDGVATPVFGPGMRNGYVEFGSAPGAAPDAAALCEAFGVAQTAHLRLCALAAARLPRDGLLAPREAEILAWAARGKSNKAIAAILGLSPHTVDTYMRRIYEKLGVNDRTSAALRGIGTGQIDLIG